MLLTSLFLRDHKSLITWYYGLNFVLIGKLKIVLLIKIYEIKKRTKDL